MGNFQTGASFVVGLDLANIIDTARNIIKDNGFEDKISLIKGRVERLDSLPHNILKVVVVLFISSLCFRGVLYTGGSHRIGVDGIHAII